ncbi:MAG: 2-isopropylmalate synthase, partial [Nitrospinae bacterium]|nr:2-isopropylmalate synthase [Nitrospinota bacterium]
LAEVNMMVEFEGDLQIAGHATSPDTVEAGAKAFVNAVNKFKLSEDMRKPAVKGRKAKEPAERPRGI